MKARLVPVTLDGFRGEYEFLSNMYPVTIQYSGHEFHSSEQLYQWLKTYGYEPYQTWVLEAKTPHKSKNISRRNGFPSSNEDDKMFFMEISLDVKFNIPEMADKLIGTDGVDLVEFNWWKDQFWGVYDGHGQNRLGKMLMNKRRQLMSK